MRLTWIATLVLCTTAAFVCGAAPDDAKPPDVTLSLYTKDTTLPDYANCQMVVEVQNNGPEEISISGSIEKEHTLSVRNDSELPRPGLAADASLTTDGYTLEIRAYQAAGYWPFISVGNTGRVPPDLHVSSGASLLLKIDRGYDLISPGTNRIRAELMNDGRLVVVSNVIQVDGVDVPDTQPIPTDFFIIGHGYDLPLRPDSSPMGDARAIAQRDSVSIEIVAEYAGGGGHEIGHHGCARVKFEAKQLMGIYGKAGVFERLLCIAKRMEGFEDFTFQPLHVFE